MRERRERREREREVRQRELRERESERGSKTCCSVRLRTTSKCGQRMLYMFDRCAEREEGSC